VTYEVIASLHRVPDLKIPAYASVRRLAGAPVTPTEVVTQLRVRLLLVSQLRQVGGQLRLDAELVDGGSDQVVRSGSWTVGPTAHAGVEAGLVHRLVELVAEGTGLATGIEQAAGLEGPAYEAYRLGQYWLNRRTPLGIRRAITAFREALARDTAYAPAWEGLSTAYMLALFYRYEIGIDGYEAAAQALAAADRAVALDPLYAPGYAARGYVVSRAFGPMDRAARDFRRALELAPNAGQAVAWSGAVFAWQGDSARALEAALRGAELDPLSPATQLGLALVVLRAGHYDQASAAARRATELEPELMESRAVEGRALVLAGKLDACLQIDYGPHAAIRAMCLHSAGRRDESDAIVDSIARAVDAGSLDDSAYTGVARADGLASYYAWIGKHELALRWVARAFAESPLGVDRRVLESRGFASMREDPVTGPQLAELTAGVWAKVTAAARRR
jgi:tetratricopeptide (TPR) repeat protein